MVSGVAVDTLLWWTVVWTLVEACSSLHASGVGHAVLGSYR